MRHPRPLQGEHFGVSHARSLLDLDHCRRAETHEIFGWRIKQDTHRKARSIRPS